MDPSPELRIKAPYGLAKEAVDAGLAEWVPTPNRSSSIETILQIGSAVGTLIALAQTPFVYQQWVELVHKKYKGSGGTVSITTSDHHSLDENHSDVDAAELAEFLDEFVRPWLQERGYLKQS